MSTDSRLSLEVGMLLTSIWNATVTSDPASAELEDDDDDDPSPGNLGLRSGETVKPDGSSGT